MEKTTRSRNFARIATVLGGGVASLIVMTGVSLASYTDPASVITPAATSLKTDLLAVAGAAAVLGIVIVGVRKGWRLAKGFFH